MDLNPMEITLTDFEINDIKNIIEKKQNCFIKIFPSFNTIWFKDEFDPFGTELRLLCLGNLRITISRVAFKNKRCGQQCSGMGVMPASVHDAIHFTGIATICFEVLDR